MDRHSRVSVIIPAYNAEQYVADAVRSVLRQDHSDMEVIVINDGSTDGTAAVLKGFGDAIMVITQENRGQAHARNVGIRRATGSIIGFLDADDLWPDDHVSTMLPFLRDDSYDFVRGYLQRVREVGTPQEERTEKVFLEAMVGACLYKRSFVDKVGLFDESMRVGEDFDWHTRIFEHGGREKRLESVALLYRRHETNMTNSKDTFNAGLFASMRNKIARTRTKPPNV